MTKRSICGVAAAQLGGQQAEVVDHLGQRLAALGDGAVEVGDVVGEGLQAAEGARELLAAAADALGAAGEQQLQVLARVGVEVERKASKLMFGSVRESGKLWPSSTWPRACAGVDLDHHVVEVRFRPQQQRRVGVDQLQVLGLDVHADDGVAFLEVDRGDLADLDAGDHDRLPLARGDRLRVAEVGA